MEQKESKRAAVSFSITIDGSIQNIFPLACPVEELKWINNWDFTMIYSDSGKNEKGCIFNEEMSAEHIQGPGRGESTYWITTEYDKENYVVHFLLVRSISITQLEITMKEQGNGKTAVTWDMTMTSHKGEGNPIFDDTVKDRMTFMLNFLGQSLKHYCETGEMLVIG